MKKIALHIILFSYSLVLLKPAAPYAKDAFAHLFFYARHMATVHYENGKMHVHYEVADNAKKEASQKEIPAAKKDNTQTDHITIPKPETNRPLQLCASYAIAVNSALQYNYLTGDYPPPRS